MCQSWGRKTGDGIATTDLVLPVDARLDLAGLNERDDLLLDLVDGPAERLAHALELDRRERLEVEHERFAADEVRQVQHVRGEVDVDVVTGLFRREVRAHRSVDMRRCCEQAATCRIPLEDVQDTLEPVIHVGLDELPDVWLLLNVHAEIVVVEDLRADGWAREGRKCAQSSIYGDVSRCDDLPGQTR